MPWNSIIRRIIFINYIKLLPMRKCVLFSLLIVGLMSACEGDDEATMLDLMTNFKDSETWVYTKIVFGGNEVPVSSDDCYSTYSLTLSKDMTFVEYNENCPMDPAKSGTFTISDDETKFYAVTGNGSADTLTITSVAVEELQLIKHLQMGPSTTNIDLTLEPQL